MCKYIQTSRRAESSQKLLQILGHFTGFYLNFCLLGCGEVWPFDTKCLDFQLPCLFIILLKDLFLHIEHVIHFQSNKPVIYLVCSNIDFITMTLNIPLIKTEMFSFYFRLQLLLQIRGFKAFWDDLAFSKHFSWRFELKFKYGSWIHYSIKYPPNVRKKNWFCPLGHHLPFQVSVVQELSQFLCAGSQQVLS